MIVAVAAQAVEPGLARRWARVIAALAAGATRAEAALAARVKVTTIARYHRDDRFAARLALACDATQREAMSRIRASSLRAADVLLAQLDADAGGVGWTRAALAARDVLDRCGIVAPASDVRAVAAAAAGGAAGAVAALTRAQLVDRVREHLGEEAARAAGRRLLLDVVDEVEDRSPADGGEGSRAPAPSAHNTAPSSSQT